MTDLSSIQQDMEQVWQELFSIPELQVRELYELLFSVGPFKLVILLIHYLQATYSKEEIDGAFKLLMRTSQAHLTQFLVNQTEYFWINSFSD